ncbi:MAG: regulatory iron-sulfur-containing complex subunit RicT [Dehalococcoidales bacterium]|nr:regulatory iron-sulfur-containing complex subunit RicT [Dehalococcoidales bacterium]
MTDIVGVRFKSVGKIYYFDRAGIELEINDYVIAETSRGLELGTVAVFPEQVSDEMTKNLKPLARKAEPDDIKHARELESKEREALKEAGKLVERFNLPMKLLSAEYNFDSTRLTLYFSTEERVDFRELARELARRLKVRIEMKQTGPRDEAKLRGGCGRCGLPLCCATFLSGFAPVSMKMAKEQSLPLNPMKISGVCGRLMCCLVYESELYHVMKQKLPKEGQLVSTAMGIARVISSNPLKETVLVELESQATTELPLSEITIENNPHHKQQKDG